MNDLRTTFTDDRPGHPRPVVRILLTHIHGTPFQAPHTVLRIHGTPVQIIAALGVLTSHGFDLDIVDAEPCTPRHGCTHSYWRGPAHLTNDDILAALPVLAGTTT